MSLADDSSNEQSPGGRKTVVKQQFIYQLSNIIGGQVAAGPRAKLICHIQTKGTLYFIKGFRGSPAKHTNKLI